IAKIDWTPYGFHALVLGASGDLFIDPYSKTDTDNYISFYQRDLPPHQRANCLVHDEEVGSLASATDAPLPAFTSGPTLRTFRLAVAATGEYTAANGGTVPSALAAITTAVNRLNGIYERDVTVRFILVANENNIIYTNAA